MIAALILATALTVAGDGDLVMRGTGVTVTLTERACPPAVANLIAEDRVARFRLAAVRLDGLKSDACWALHDPRTIVIVYDDKSAGFYSIEKFIRRGLSI